MKTTTGDDKMSKEIQKAEAVAVVQAQPVTPMEMIASAQASGADIETISKYMDLQERYENREALREYNKAVAMFKTENTVIYKNVTVDFKTSKGRMHYKHETIDNVVNTVTPLLAKYDLNHSWSSKQDNNSISITCKLSHAGGHSESVVLSGPYDTSGLKNGAQSVVSTGTLLRRHTLMMILGLASGDPDNDGRGAPAKSAPVDVISEHQEAELEALITEVGADRYGFVSYLKIDSLDQLPKDRYASAVKDLERKRGSK
ncbi:ERF family protein [Candidatus Pacearchaeota archaeon]|nr:ERF family protein [Candidatus Pacearchaeota archaeon]